MKLLFDLLPVACFFAVYWVGGIFAATAAAIAATVAQVAWLKLRRRRVDPMLWVSFAIIVVFGGLTLALHDRQFIMWKPTVLYWIFSAALAVSALGFRRNLVRALLGEQLRLPEAAWRALNWSWVAFFFAMGIANLYVARNYSEATWVKFKAFGGLGLMLLFVLAQALFLARYVEEGKR